MLWAAGLIVEFLTPLVAWKVIGGTPVDREHIEERFGLFTIIVLGEAVIAVVAGTDVKDWAGDAVLVATFGFAGAVSLWWIYFDGLTPTDSALHSVRWRWSLLREKDYLFTNTLYIGRGCPWRCDFCYNSSPNFDARYRIAWREDADLEFALRRRGATIGQARAAVVVHPIRPAPWGVSLKQQRKVLFDALLYKKHPRAYRTLLRPRPPWHYYAAVLALFAATLAATAGAGRVATLALAVWLTVTVRCLPET